jgi:nitrate reductase NapAB chaperone NapD
MAICGLVITLGPAGSAALAQLASEPWITVGEAPVEARRIPVVLEAEDRAEYLARWQQLVELDGVAHLDLAYVYYDDADGIEDNDDGEPGE